MNKKIIEILLIIFGLCLIAFPIILNYISSYYGTVAITNYQEQIDQMTAIEKDEEFEKAQKYNENLKKETLVEVSIDNSDSELQENKSNVSYLNVLNIGKVMAYISIPKIDIYIPIYHGLSENVLQSGVGHAERTSLPIGGKGTHCVLAGHTGLARAKFFDDIDQLQIGDKFYINVVGEIHTYEVDKIDIVEPNNTDAIKIEDDKDYVTLVTCTPHFLNTHRLLVRGTRVENDDSSNTVDEDKTNDIPIKNEDLKNQVQNAKLNNRIKIDISIAVLIIVIIILLIFKRKTGR